MPKKKRNPSQPSITKTPATARRWQFASLILTLVIVAGGATSYRALSKARSEVAALRLQLSDSTKRTPKKVESSVVDSLAARGETRSYLAYRLANAKLRPGTQEALKMLEGQQPFDVLRANLLIAKGIPQCENVDMGKVDAWYESLAEEIRSHVAAMRQTAEGQKYLAEKGEPEFKMACANEVIVQSRKIAYVENDAVRADLPWHLFCHGVAEKGRGTCVTMALAWKIVADKLGWRMYLRNAPTHLYLAWNDGKYQTNLEATDSAKSVKDEEYRKREGVSEEDYRTGRYMRDMTSRQMLAAFVSCRAQHWNAVGEPTKSFEDTLLAVQLDPNCPAYRTNLLRHWDDVRQRIDREFEAIVGVAALATFRTERSRAQARENAQAHLATQTARIKQQSGITSPSDPTRAPLRYGQQQQ